MVDGGWHANAWSDSYCAPLLRDDRVLNAFHTYEPYEATSSPKINRKPQLRYPGAQAWLGRNKVTWNQAVMHRFLAGPFDWATAKAVPANPMVTGELGCVWKWVDFDACLEDVLSTLDGYGGH